MIQKIQLNMNGFNQHNTAEENEMKIVQLKLGQNSFN